ncbi:MAG: trypsin-like peptidase domain-containing protein, partial [Verrucomicrobiota bacterium]
MKRKFLLQACAAFLGAMAFGFVPAVQADAKKYQNLKESLVIDKSEAESPGVSSYAPALEQVMPAVVTIFASKSVRVERTRNSQQEEMLKRFFDIPDELLEQYREEAPERQQQGLGSGVVISSDGYILTNNHVVADADEIKVTLPENQKEYDAELIGGDPRTDIALLKIEAKGLKQITIGDSSRLRIGDVVLAVGNPLTLEQSASIGIVSALGRNELNITNGGYENFIQTDAA